MALSILTTLSASAQIVYQCDFEDAAQRAEWTLNVGTQASQVENQWYIGQEGNFSEKGSHGLYISSDGGQTARFKSTKASYIVCYDEISTLTPGTYTLSFDWRAMCGPSTLLYVDWVPAGTATNSGNSLSRTWFTSTYKVGEVRGKRLWQSAQMPLTVTAADSPGKLVFVWYTNGTEGNPEPPSICIDNIVIRQATGTRCNAPSKPTINYDKNTRSVTLTWAGGSGLYDVRDYNTNDGHLVEYSAVNANTLKLNLYSEGEHIFYVRSLCDEDSTTVSQWVASDAQFVWIPGIRCIDYMDIGRGGNFNGQCYTGDYDSYRASGKPLTPEYIPDKTSFSGLHQMHTSKDEIVPVTTIGGGLPTVPEGEIASIRVGDVTYSGNNGKSSSIEYKYTVLQGMSDLLDIKYAVVMQAGGHGNENPSFRLDVLDGQGLPLASSCTQINFIVGMGDQEMWHWEGEPNGYDVPAWCDWQKLTVSLRPYVGQTLTIRFSSIRCDVNTHYACGFFTMGCRSGDVDGLACGDTSTDHFDAPAGFTYRWYKEKDPLKTTVGTAQRFNINPDDADIYMVECHTLYDPDCYFTLTCNPNPRYPVAQIDTTRTSANCQNLMMFANSSVIKIINRVTEEVMSEEDPLYTCVYHFGDEEEGQADTEFTGLNLSHEYPAEGGHFDAYVVASMNDGMCTDTAWFSFDLPDLVHTAMDDTVHICRPETYTIPGTREVIDHDTIYTTYSRNKYGCEAPSDHYVFFHDSVKAESAEELCEGGYIVFEGDTLRETGIYRYVLNTQYGCDSILMMDLYVIPRLEVEIPDTVEICGEEGNMLVLPIKPLKGKYNGVTVLFDSLSQQSFERSYTFGPDDAVEIPLPEGVLPDYYSMTLDFATDACPADARQMTAVVHYAASVIDQKYGFIGLLNEHYNYGGFEYIGYQWYQNGQPLLGDTLSYIHVTDADLNTEFYAEVVRKSDGVVLTTCPIIYNGGQTALHNANGSVTVTPTVLSAGQSMMVSGGQSATIYDALGRQWGSIALSETHMNVVKAPEASGIYFVVVDQHETVKIIVR